MKTIKNMVNMVKSIPTRVSARREYNNNMYEMKRVGGSQPVRTKRATPLRTYNKAR